LKIKKYLIYLYESSIDGKDELKIVNEDINNSGKKNDELDDGLNTNNIDLDAKNDDK
jgi:hypothetical protein